MEKVTTAKLPALPFCIPEFPRPNLISGASHPDRILVVFLVPAVDFWMAGQMLIRPRLLPY